MIVLPKVLQKTAKARYAQLETVRLPFLRRARRVATVTIPSLMPPEGFTGVTELPTPYQSLGARCFSILASKLLFALLPPNTAFFKYNLTDAASKDLAGRDDMRGQIEKALSSFEREILAEVEGRAMRAAGAELFLQLLTAGNVLARVPETGKVSIHRLDSFVVRRQNDGEPLEIILKEMASVSSLPEEQQLLALNSAEKGSTSTDLADAKVPVYTWITRKGDRWSYHQEIGETRVAGSDGSYPADAPEWLPLRWSSQPGQDYGRGRGEEYLGDFLTLETLSKAITQAAEAAARVIGLVKPNGLTDVTEVNKAENGDFVNGDAEDISFLQLDKHGDFRIAEATIDRLDKRLSQAFLLNSSVQRAGERVTAEEIRYMAAELEDTLGGTYSVLGQEFQLPLGMRIDRILQARGRTVKLPDNAVKPVIVAGLDALGRGHDLRKLDTFIGGLRETFGDAVVAEYVRPGEYMARRAASLGIDTNGLLNTDDEVAANRQAQQEQAMLAQATPNAVNQLGQMAQKGMEAPA